MTRKALHQRNSPRALCFARRYPMAHPAYGMDLVCKVRLAELCCAVCFDCVAMLCALLTACSLSYCVQHVWCAAGMLRIYAMIYHCARNHASAVHCRWINEEEVDDVADFARWLPEEHDEYDEGADSGDGDGDGVYRGLPMFDPHASHQRDYMKQFSERVYLSTEFHEKEKVKAMGARWDPECPRDDNPSGLRGKWCGTGPLCATPASDKCSAKLCRGVMVTNCSSLILIAAEYA